MLFTFGQFDPLKEYAIEVDLSFMCFSACHTTERYANRKEGKRRSGSEKFKGLEQILILCV